MNRKGAHRPSKYASGTPGGLGELWDSEILPKALRPWPSQLDLHSMHLKENPEGVEWCILNQGLHYQAPNAGSSSSVSEGTLRLQ